jgi:hypothetical protein
MTVATGLEEMITEEKLAPSVTGTTARTPPTLLFPFRLTFVIVNEISGLQHYELVSICLVKGDLPFLRRKQMKSKLFLMTAVAAALSLAVPGMAQTPAAKTTDQAKSGSTKKAVEAAPAPTEKGIADAKAKGMVWINTNTKVYHKDGEFYGKTKKGKFMAEDDAKKAGFRAAQEPAAKKIKTDAKKT